MKRTNLFIGLSWGLLFWCAGLWYSLPAHAERMIPVPESTLKQLLMESNQQEQILIQLEKNNAMQQTELAELKRELKISNDKLIVAEIIFENAEQALKEANESFELYSKEQKAKIKNLETDLKAAKGKNKFYKGLAGVLAGGLIGSLAFHK